MNSVELFPSNLFELVFSEFRLSQLSLSPPQLLPQQVQRSDDEFLRFCYSSSSPLIARSQFSASIPSSVKWLNCSKTHVRSCTDKEKWLLTHQYLSLTKTMFWHKQHLPMGLMMEMTTHRNHSNWSIHCWKSFGQVMRQRSIVEIDTVDDANWLMSLSRPNVNVNCSRTKTKFSSRR